MKKIISWLAVLALTLTAAIGATAAYMTAATEDPDVMTEGRVRIDQLEYERIDAEAKGETAKVRDFHNDLPFFPGVYPNDFDWSTDSAFVDWTQISKEGYTSGIWDPQAITNEHDKMVFVRNKGNRDSYVRTVFGFESAPGWTLEIFRENVHLNLNDQQWSWEWVQTPITVGGGTYFIATATYNAPLAPDQITEISLAQLALDKAVTNEICESLGNTYQVLAKTQAVEASDFTDAKTALDTAFSPIDANNTPFEHDTPIPGVDLKTALHYLDGEEENQITASVEQVIFGKLTDYYDIAMTNDGTAITIEQDGEVKAYYVMDDEGLYTVYVLSDDTIYTPRDSTGLFQDMTVLAAVDTANLDVGRTQIMDEMFSSCTALTQLDVSNWSTSNVTSARNMFYFCRSLTALDVTDWDTSNMTCMSGMFLLDTNDAGSSELIDLDVSQWDTSKVTDMSFMFYGCFKLPALELGGWDVSQVTTLQRMFSGCKALEALDIGGWNVSNCTSLRDTFVNCESLPSLDLSRWNVSKVTDLQGTFCGLLSCTNLNLTGWDTSNVTNMLQTFWNCRSVTQIPGISDWDTSNVQTMRGLFAYCGLISKEFTVDVSNWDTSKVTNMEYMFYMNEFTTIIGLENLDTGNVTNLQRMFYDCEAMTELNLSGWDTSKVTNMAAMFRYCRYVKTIYVGDGWTMDNVTSSSNMFQHSTKLVGGNGTVYNSGNVGGAYAHVDVEGNPGYFTHINDKPVADAEPPTL